MTASQGPSEPVREGSKCYLFTPAVVQPHVIHGGQLPINTMWLLLLLPLDLFSHLPSLLDGFHHGVLIPKQGGRVETGQDICAHRTPCQRLRWAFQSAAALPGMLHSPDREGHVCLRTRTLCTGPRQPGHRSCAALWSLDLVFWFVLLCVFSSWKIPRHCSLSGLSTYLTDEGS